ncbi:DUF7848 domain-containing protein [Streptomyces jumonjinensis]
MRPHGIPGPPVRPRRGGRVDRARARTSHPRAHALPAAPVTTAEIFRTPTARVIVCITCGLHSGPTAPASSSTPWPLDHATTTGHRGFQEVSTALLRVTGSV